MHAIERRCSGSCARSLIVAAVATLAIPANAHDLLSADPSATAERYAWQFEAAQQEAADAHASSTTLSVAQSVYDDFLKWPFLGMSATVTVCFWNGSDAARKAVIDADRDAWEGFANVTFDYTTDANTVRVCTDANSADVRISLDPSDAHLDYDAGRPANGDWSFVGTQANFNVPNMPAGTRYKVTVNLPEVEMWVAMHDLGDISTYVSHELGHARGLLHEHQRSECSGWFNIPEIAHDNGWSLEQATQNIASFQQLGDAAGHPTYAGPYDVLSVMQYNFRPTWWLVKAGETNPCLRTVNVQAPSPGDKATLIAAYGLPPPAAPPAVAPGAPPPSAPPIVASAPGPQRMGFADAVRRLAPAIAAERARARLTSTANIDLAISRLPAQGRERMHHSIEIYRDANVAADKNAALTKAMDRLETLSAQMANLKEGH
jgi:hypothetical protein